MYTIAIANPRRIRRFRKLTGGDSASAMNEAISSQAIGRRSRYRTYTKSATAKTIVVARNTACVDKRTTQTSTSAFDVLANA